MLKYSWNITLPLTIVTVFGLSIGGYGLMNKTDFHYRFDAKFKNWLRIEIEFDKCQVK
jgi:hypothetical protein